MKRATLITTTALGALLLAAPVLAHGVGGPASSGNGPGMGQMGQMMGEGSHNGAKHEAMHERMAANMGQHGERSDAKGADCPFDKKTEKTE